MSDTAINKLEESIRGLRELETELHNVDEMLFNAEERVRQYKLRKADLHTQISAVRTAITAHASSLK